MADIRHLDFNQLPRATRERFIAITKNLAGPPPIFQNRTGAGGMAGWIILMIFAGMACLGILMVEFGRPYTATQPAGFVIGYIILGFLLFLGFFGMLKSLRAGKVVPFAPGVYVFPMDTIVARD